MWLADDAAPSPVFVALCHALGQRYTSALHCRESPAQTVRYHVRQHTPATLGDETATADRPFVRVIYDASALQCDWTATRTVANDRFATLNPQWRRRDRTTYDIVVAPVPGKDHFGVRVLPPTVGPANVPIAPSSPRSPDPVSRVTVGVATTASPFATQRPQIIAAEALPALLHAVVRQVLADQLPSAPAAPKAGLSFLGGLSVRRQMLSATVGRAAVVDEWHTADPLGSQVAVSLLSAEAVQDI